MKTDDELREDVIKALQWNAPQFNNKEIHVVVKGGAVTLTGITETVGEKLAAERAVKHVKGVRVLATNIEVRPPTPPEPPDENLAERIASVLTWSNFFRGTKVQAEVRQGRVILTGEVEFLYQKEGAAKRIEELDGVVGVWNELTVRPRPETNKRELKRQIMDALHRHASIEALNVAVSVDGGRVTLDGTVGAYHERDLIEDTVRAAPGVSDIIDNLTVA